MKHQILKLITSLSALLIVSSAFSQEQFYSLIPNTALHYEIVDDEGEGAGHYILRTDKVTGTPDEGEIVFIYNFFKKNGHPLFDDNDFRMKVVSKDGDRTAYFDGLSATMKTQDFMAKGDVSTLKPDMKVGAYPDSYVIISVGSIKTNMNVIEREFLKKENITVPAGTFECYKLKERQTVKFMGFGTNDYITTWYAPGIGLVKQEIYNKKGKLQKIHTLVKVEEGK